MNPDIDGKPIPGYSGYCITPDGQLWSKKKKDGKTFTDKWKPLKGFIDKGGYLCYMLCQNNKIKRKVAHRLVLEIFVGCDDLKMFACHNNGDTSNNHISNLRWDTALGNQADRKKHGTSLEGCKNPKAKLNERDILKIREMRNLGRTYSDIAKTFGISNVMASLICRRKNWIHVE